LKNFHPRKISGPRFNRFYTQSRDPQAEIGENLNPFLHRVWLVDYGIAAAITKKKRLPFSGNSSVQNTGRARQRRPWGRAAIAGGNGGARRLPRGSGRENGGCAHLGLGLPPRELGFEDSTMDSEEGRRFGLDATGGLLWVCDVIFRKWVGTVWWA
jgi:hypothetical protein